MTLQSISKEEIFKALYLDHATLPYTLAILTREKVDRANFNKCV